MDYKTQTNELFCFIFSLPKYLCRGCPIVYGQWKIMTLDEDKKSEMSYYEHKLLDKR